MFDPSECRHVPTAESIKETRRAAKAMEAAELVFVHLAQTEQFDDITIGEYAELFIEWSEHWTGKAGTILRDEGQLYRSLHDVGPGQNTKPSETPSMWVRVADPGEEWPEWIAPTGAHNAYPLGAKVSYQGKHWINTREGNAYAPGVAGWEEAG